MNCLKCFNVRGLTGCKSFAARFLSFWCLDGARRGVLPPCHLCAPPGASMVPGVEYCHRATFAPFLVP